MFLLSLYLQKTIKNCQNVLAKDLKDQFIGMNIKQKVRTLIQQMNIVCLAYSNPDDNSKRFKTRRCNLPKSIINFQRDHQWQKLL